MVHNVARVERETREAGREEPVNICGGFQVVGVSSRAPFPTALDRSKGRIVDDGTRVPADPVHFARGLLGENRNQVRP